MIFSAVFLIGFSTLAFEVLLTRIFSIGQWNHLSFMVISIALFGFAASGTFLSIFDTRRSNPPLLDSIPKTTALLALMYSSMTILAFVILNNLPLDYFRLPVDPIQALYLLIAFIILMLSFFFSGLVVAVAYTRIPEKTGWIYFATMCGSACGAIFPGVLLPFFCEGKLVIISALIPLIVIPLAFMRSKRDLVVSKNPHSVQMLIGIGSLVLVFWAVYLLTPYGIGLIRVKPSSYKALSQVLQFPNTRIDETINHIRGRIDRVVSPHIRFAPGLSLRYMQTIASQNAVFKDGENQVILYALDSLESTRFSRYTLSYSGYVVHSQAQKVLVILQGGGTAIPAVLEANLPDITLVVGNPVLAEMMRKHYGLSVTAQAPRVFLSQTANKYDIIHVENWGTSIPGSDALSQDHLYTIDAFLQYLRHLTPEGLVIVSRKLLLPPADGLRLWASAYEALKRVGAKNPEAHLAVLRNWDTFSLLVFKQPFLDTARLQDFVRKLNFDLVYLSGMTVDQANRFNKFETPYHFIEINRLAAAYAKGNEKAYFKSYLLDIGPQSDDRPFPGRFLKWRKLKSLYKTLGSRLYALLMSGEIVVSVVFFEALTISGVLLILPLLFVRRNSKNLYVSQMLYFFGVGAGFMFIELFFIKKYILLFGDPVISFTFVLAAVLVFSSFGGIWAQKKDKQILKMSLITLIGAILITLITIDTLIEYLLGVSIMRRQLGAVLIIMPIGFLMGLPFPLGMRDMLKSPIQRAYAWSINGCASVLTSIFSAQIALISGISYILGCAIAAYLIVICSWHYLERNMN